MPSLTDPPAVAVCGFGRCGTTMAMAALDAGGITPVAGAAQPSYEHTVHEAAGLHPDAVAGHSVKLLDPIERGFFPPARSWRLIWLDRNPHQQAKSTVKLLRQVASVRAAAVKEFETWFADQRNPSIELLRTLGPVYVTSYEQALADPLDWCTDLAIWLYPDFVLHITRAAAAIHRRRPHCVDGLTFELTGATP